MAFLIHQVHPGHHEALASVLQFLFLHQKKNYLNHGAQYFQYFAVLFSIWKMPADLYRDWVRILKSKVLVIKIILDCIQLELFVIMFCHNEILHWFDIFILQCFIYLGVSHFDLYYLYSNISKTTCDVK